MAKGLPSVRDVGAQQNEHAEETEIYLLASLNGEAASLVQGLQFYKENYEQVVTILKETFRRQDNLTEAYMKDLANVEAVRSFKDIDGLK